MPAHLPGLLVIDPSLTANCPAPECEFDVLDLVTVAVGNWLRDGYRCQLLRGGDYAGLFEALTHSRIGWLLPWLDDAAGQGPAPGVRSTPQQHLPFIVHDDSDSYG